MTDLWPDGISSRTSLKTPVAILGEQGTLLGKKTNNLVEGMIVRVRETTFGGDFGYTFYLSAPALSGYRYQLLEISYPVGLYPLIITISDESVVSEIPEEMQETRGIFTANSEDNFIDILRKIFATKKVKQVIDAIIAQSDVYIEPK